MFSIGAILLILFVHWFADFCLQTHWQAVNKSQDNLALTEHVFNYSFVWLLVCMYWISYSNDLRIMLFVPITYISHWATDYVTSRVNKTLWAKAQITGKPHNFFVSVGFDQLLHYAQLFGTYYILTK